MSLGLYINNVAREAVQYSLSINSTLGERATFNVRIVSTDGSYRPEQGHPLELWDGANKLWGGTVDEVVEVSITEAGAATGAFYDIRGVTWEQRLDRRRCYDIQNDVPAVYDRNFVFTADDATDTITTEINHGRSDGDLVKVKAHAQGTLCGGLDEAIEYYVINSTANTLQLSLTNGGSAVDITDPGTLDQVLITYRAGEIVRDLLNTFAAFEGIGDTNIDDGAVIDTITFEPDTTVTEAISQIATLSGFVWWIDYDRELWFKPATFAAAPFNITLTSGNYRSLSVRNTREEKINSVFVGIDWRWIPVTTETFTGDGTTTVFTLANRAGLIASIDLNSGTEQTHGQFLAETERNWYWSYGSDQLRQDPDDAVLTGGDTLTVNYYQLGQNVVFREDSADVTATATQEIDGSGRYQTYYEKDLGQVQAALDAENLIARQKAVAQEIEYETDQEVEPLCTTVRPGQIQTIENTTRGVPSDSFLIREVRISDVGGAWLKFTVKAINGSLLSTAEYWKSISGGGRRGGGGGGGGAGGAQFFIRFSDENDTIQTGADVGNNWGRIDCLPTETVVVEECSITAKNQPSGSSLIVDLLVSTDYGATWASIFPSGSSNKLVLPASTTSATQNIFDIAAFSAGDLLRVDYVQVGAGQSGGKLLISFNGRVI
jgi:hypothetical protein